MNESCRDLLCCLYSNSILAVTGTRDVEAVAVTHRYHHQRHCQHHHWQLIVLLPSWTHAYNLSRTNFLNDSYFQWRLYFSRPNWFKKNRHKILSTTNVSLSNLRHIKKRRKKKKKKKDQKHTDKLGIANDRRCVAFERQNYAGTMTSILTVNTS